MCGGSRLTDSCSYNSVVFNATSANAYIAALVTEEFTEGGGWRRTWVEGIDTLSQFSGTYAVSRISDLQNSIGSLERLDIDVCTQTYESSRFQSVWGDVLFVTSSNYTSSVLGLVGLHPGWGFSNLSGLERLWDVQAQYCLARRTEEHCEVRIHISLFWVVIACNALQAACLIATAIFPGFKPLATCGDAIVSFSTAPETLTAEGPLSAADVREKHTENSHSVFAQRTLLPCKNERRRRGAVVSFWEWSACIAL